LLKDCNIPEVCEDIAEERPKKYPEPVSADTPIDDED